MGKATLLHLPKVSSTNLINLIIILTSEPMKAAAVPVPAKNDNMALITPSFKKKEAIVGQVKDVLNNEMKLSAFKHVRDQEPQTGKPEDKSNMPDVSNLGPRIEADSASEI